MSFSVKTHIFPYRTTRSLIVQPAWSCFLPRPYVSASNKLVLSSSPCCFIDICAFWVWFAFFKKKFYWKVHLQCCISFCCTIKWVSYTYVCINMYSFLKAFSSIIAYYKIVSRVAFLMAHMVKNLPAIWKTQVWSLRWKDPLERGMATHSSILAWRIPWTEETGGLQSMGLQRVRHDWATNTFTFPVLYSRSLLVIYFIYSNVHILPPNS